jgi:hypothetical protein
MVQGTRRRRTPDPKLSPRNTKPTCGIRGKRLFLYHPTHTPCAKVSDPGGDA